MLHKSNNCCHYRIVDFGWIICYFTWRASWGAETNGSRVLCLKINKLDQILFLASPLLRYILPVRDRISSISSMRLRTSRLETSTFKTSHQFISIFNLWPVKLRHYYKFYIDSTSHTVYIIGILRIIKSPMHYAQLWTIRVPITHNWIWIQNMLPSPGKCWWQCVAPKHCL